MKREQAIEIAQSCAKAKPQSYYAEPFQPHEWVIDAIQLGVRLYGAQSLPEPTNWKGVKWRDSIKASNLAQKIALHFAHDCHDSMCGEDANASNCESAWVEDKLSEWLDEMAAPPTTVAGTAPPGVTVQQNDSQWLRDETEVWRQRWMACNAANDMDFYEWAFKTQLTAEATRLAGAAPLMAYCSNPKCDYTFPLPGTTSGIIWACPKCYGNDYHVNSEAPGAYFVSAPDSRLATLLTRLRGLRDEWRAELHRRCQWCKQGWDLGAHGCHFEPVPKDQQPDEYGGISENCKAFGLTKRIAALDTLVRTVEG